MRAAVATAVVAACAATVSALQLVEHDGGATPRAIGVPIQRRAVAKPVVSPSRLRRRAGTVTETLTNFEVSFRLRPSSSHDPALWA